MYDTKKRLVMWAIFTAFILSIFFVVMQFTEEVNWDLFDFILMGSVFFGIAFTYELIAKRSNLPAGEVGKTLYQAAFGVGLLGIFLLFWVNGAVGIIGSENNPANLMYGAVFAVGLIGSLMARFKPFGMTLTLSAAAIVQMLVPVAALIIWPPPIISWTPSVFGVFVLSGFFAMLFVISALLFRQAAQTPNSLLKNLKIKN